MNHIEKSKDLGLDPEEYVLIGGSTLDVYAVRSSDDIDVVVSKRAFQELKDRGWEVDQAFTEKWGRERIVHDVFEVVTHFYWEAYDYYMSFEALRDVAKKIDGVYVEPLGFRLIGKLDVGRDKDMRDVALIEKYFQAL